MRAVRQTIATVLELPSDLVLDANLSPDVSALKSFITVGIVSSQQVGNEYKFNGGNEKEIITASRLTTVSVNAYGVNAYLLIEKLASLFRTSKAKQMFKRNRLTILKTSAIRNLPTAIAGGFEQRAQIDLTISHIHRIETLINRIDSVDLLLHEEKQ